VVKVTTEYRSVPEMYQVAGRAWPNLHNAITRRISAARSFGCSHYSEESVTQRNSETDEDHGTKDLLDIY